AAAKENEPDRSARLVHFRVMRASAYSAGFSSVFSAGAESGDVCDLSDFPPPLSARLANWCLRSLRLRRRPALRRAVPLGVDSSVHNWSRTRLPASPMR